MKVKLSPPNAHDIHYLIDLPKFMEIVDQDDLARRKSKTIRNAYHQYWFDDADSAFPSFDSPVFYLDNGVARFINGRHRTLMLLRHLDCLPMALASLDGCPFMTDQPSSASVSALREISIRRINNQETFEFPCLPIVYLGFDQNIGK